MGQSDSITGGFLDTVSNKMQKGVVREKDRHRVEKCERKAASERVTDKITKRKKTGTQNTGFQKGPFSREHMLLQN